MFVAGCLRSERPFIIIINLFFLLCFSSLVNSLLVIPDTVIMMTMMMKEKELQKPETKTPHHRTRTSAPADHPPPCVFLVGSIHAMWGAGAQGGPGRCAQIAAA